MHVMKNIMNYIQHVFECRIGEGAGVLVLEVSNLHFTSYRHSSIFLIFHNLCHRNSNMQKREEQTFMQSFVVMGCQV